MVDDTKEKVAGTIPLNGLGDRKINLPWDSNVTTMTAANERKTMLSAGQEVSTIAATNGRETTHP
jgi:hypothetical protein